MNKLKEILNNWNLKYFEISPLKKGLVNEKWIVRTDSSDLILRNTGTNPKYVEAQVILLDYLGQSNFSYHTPKLKSTKKNTKYIKYKDHYFYVYGFIEGFPIIEQQNISTSYYIGKLVGEYSKSVAKVNLPNGSTFVHMLERNTLDTFPHLVQNSTHLEKSLENLLDTLNEIYNKDYGNLRNLVSIPCHLDYSPNNILTEDSIKPIALIDFGSIAMKPKICDVSNALQNVCGLYGKCNNDLIKSFFKGYLESQRLSNLELSLIYPLIVDELVRAICWHTNRIDNYSKREDVFLKKRVKLLDSLIETPMDFSILI